MSAVLLSASVTPLRDGGTALDEDAIGPLVEFLQAGGADGVFCCGTTGEGVLLSADERRRALLRFREACTGTLIVHCGAQTTADTAVLTAHAAANSADAVAVIPPPYYPLDEDGMVDHFAAAANACAPLPFYLYAFTARSGYSIPIAVVERVRERCDNIAGMKVSESPFSAVEPYLSLGLQVYVGSEPLIPQALAAGATGAVSGLASAFPDRVAAVVRNPSEDGARELGELRGTMGTTHFIANLKRELGRRGVPVRPDMRAPLKPSA